MFPITVHFSVYCNGESSLEPITHVYTNIQL